MVGLDRLLQFHLVICKTISWLFLKRCELVPCVKLCNFITCGKKVKEETSILPNPIQSITWIFIWMKIWEAIPQQPTQISPTQGHQSPLPPPSEVVVDQHKIANPFPLWLVVVVVETIIPQAHNSTPIILNQLRQSTAVPRPTLSRIRYKIVARIAWIMWHPHRFPAANDCENVQNVPCTEPPANEIVVTKSGIIASLSISTKSSFIRCTSIKYHMFHKSRSN